MHDLVELFEAGTVKDYTPLIEWELCKVNIYAANKMNAKSVSLTNTVCRTLQIISKAKVNTVTFGETLSINYIPKGLFFFLHTLMSFYNLNKLFIYTHIYKPTSQTKIYILP
jgi:hypothetical protein